MTYTPQKPPIAARKPVQRVHHGITFTDDYEWLRDKDDPEVIAHLQAELRQHVPGNNYPDRIADLDELGARADVSWRVHTDVITYEPFGRNPHSGSEHPNAVSA